MYSDLDIADPEFLIDEIEPEDPEFRTRRGWHNPEKPTGLKNYPRQGRTLKAYMVLMAQTPEGEFERVLLQHYYARRHRSQPITPTSLLEYLQSNGMDSRERAFERTKETIYRWRRWKVGLRPPTQGMVDRALRRGRLKADLRSDRPTVFTFRPALDPESTDRLLAQYEASQRPDAQRVLG